MTTNLSDAYDVTTEFETSILNDLKSIQDEADAFYAERVSKLTAILDRFPAGAQNTQVFQCARSMRDQTNGGYYNYLLGGLRQQYQLDPAPTMPVTPAPGA